MNDEKFSEEIAQLPLLQYEWIAPTQLEFSSKVRWICETQCPMYNTTWACPPAVGTLDQCKEKCLSYEKILLITTVSEVSDIGNIEETLATRPEHEAITRQVETLLLECGAAKTYVLSTEACAHCKDCTWPDNPCRHPQKMYPCVESHGIVVTALANEYGIEFLSGNLVVWFSILFFS